ncbi:MAG: D-tyrosyl-tRNA(Tyr) deacylase [Erysipelotrichia bacterium]|jgi:D-tyrosyl-tRNA(Tyr) deacylase|nr:D-tyrosyl-tRNA(Tyr) deacylase [Erysipelotrichia bacterium]
MKIVVQRVLEASVKVDQVEISKIGIGYCLFVGLCLHDNETIVQTMAKKVSKLRIFEDEEGKMNLDIHASTKDILSISQFTLCADTRKGNRPSFTNALKAEEAKILFEKFNQALEHEGLNVQTGIFQADMKVHLVNDGPLTIILEDNHDTYS